MNMYLECFLQGAPLTNMDTWIIFNLSMDK